MGSHLLDVDYDTYFSYLDTGNYDVLFSFTACQAAAAGVDLWGRGPYTLLAIVICFKTGLTWQRIADDNFNGCGCLFVYCYFIVSAGTN